MIITLTSCGQRVKKQDKKPLKDLAKYTGEAGVKFDEDVIHELRTTFKKLRALLRWQNTDKNIYSIFKKIYDVAGELRNNF